jgi:Protein of unknown function (DUF1194)
MPRDARACAHAPATAGPELDVALLLAGDISNSINAEEQALQREGFIAAFRSPLVHDANRKGAHGRRQMFFNIIGPTFRTGPPLVTLMRLPQAPRRPSAGSCRPGW